MRDQTDTQLLDQYRNQKSEKALESLVERYLPMVQGVCARVLNGRADSQDASHAVFAALALKADGLNSEAGLAAWLHQTAHTVSRDLVGQGPRLRNRGTASLADRLEDLDAAIKILPPQLLAPVIHHYLLGWPMLQIAAVGGLPPNSVAIRLNNAGEHLRKALALPNVAGAAALLAMARPRKADAATASVEAAMQAIRAALRGEGAVKLARNVLSRWNFKRMALNSAPVIAFGAALGALLALLTPAPTAARSLAQTQLHEIREAVGPAPAISAVEAQACFDLLEDHPLIRASKARYRWEELLEFKRVLDETPGPIDNIRDQFGRTALHWAALSRGNETALLLLMRGASVNARDMMGKTPLTYSVEANQDSMLLQLLLAGADPNVVAIDQSTPLAWAALHDKPQMCEILLRMGADLHPEGVIGKWLPNEAARTGGSQEVLAVFARYEAVSLYPTGFKNVRSTL